MNELGFRINKIDMIYENKIKFNEYSDILIIFKNS